MLESSRDHRWFLCSQERVEAKLRLFCLPFAGGGASAFHSWSEALPDAVEVRGIQLPGRESRFREQAMVSAPPLVEQIADALEPWLDRPFSLLGYSMGGALAFELSRALRRRSAPMPTHLIVASRIAPQLPNVHPPMAHLPKEQLLQEVRRFFDPPDAAWENPELLALVLPALRADMTMCDTYVYVPEPPLDCAIHSFAGAGDRSAPLACVREWKEQTTNEFTLQVVPGGHFFIFSERIRFQSLVAELLRTSLERSS